MRIYDCRADTGISTLILFIAIVIMASLVATVLMDTTGLVTEKAVHTGKETKTQVTTGIKVVSVSGKMTDDGITCINLTIEPIAESGIIDLDTTIITISAAGNPRVFLKYNRTSNSYSDGFFNVSRWIRIDGDVSDRVDNPYIESGDLIEISTDTTADASDFSPNTEVVIDILLETGFDSRIEFRTPLSYVSGEQIGLY